MNEIQKFELSNLPTDIHYYECYYDPSKTKLIKGEEYDAGWDDTTKKRWDFFYRPLEEFLPQNNFIFRVEKAIVILREKLKTTINLLLFGTLTVLIIVLFSYFKFGHDVFSFLLIATYGFLSFSKYKDIDLYESEIVKHEHQIKKLNEELDYLINQIPIPISEKDIDKDFKDDIARMEIESLNEILDEKVDKKTIKKIIQHEQFDPNKVVKGILIKSIAFLQSTIRYSSAGEENTGINRFYNEIENNIFTWYEVRNREIDEDISLYSINRNKYTTFDDYTWHKINLKNNINYIKYNSYIYPYFYRALYIQYVYLLKNSISTYSFFYDFVTQKKYGIRSETYQYNHISNLSINQVEISTINTILNKYNEKGFLKNFTSNEIHTFTLSATSGMHFKCVFVDNSVVDSIINWENEKKVHYEETYKNIKDTDFQRHRESIQENLNTVYKAIVYIKSKINESS